MGHELTANPARRFNREVYELFDDFDQFVTADLWTSAVVGTGTVTRPATAATNIRLLSTADNDAAVLATTGENFKFTGGKSMYAECQLTFTDPQTSLGSIAFGWADAMAATLLADDGGAATVINDGCIIYKIETELVWRFHTELGTLANKAGDGSSSAPTASTVSTTASGGGVSQQLSIDITPRSSTIFEARPFVDGVQLKDANGIPIMHALALGTATDMDFGFVMKGFHADDMIATSDYVYASQVR